MAIEALPITDLSRSAAGAQLRSAVRTLLVAAAAYASGKGWIPGDVAQAIVPVILIGVPLAWGQLEARLNKRLLVQAALTDPAQIKVRP
jgi:hypothetical protein